MINRIVLSILYIGIYTIPLPLSAAKIPWIRPNKQLAYNQVCFLAAHNAFSHKEDRWRYRQQKWGLKKQLDRGIRALLLDIHEQQDTIKLCHKFCTFPFSLQKQGPYKSFSQELVTIKEWLDEHPTEIVTIILESYLKTDNLLKETIEEVPGLAELILTKKDWDAAAQNGAWPSIAWLQQRNKRIVIFNDNITAQGSTAYTFYEWDHVIENQFGTHSIKKAAQERKESKQCAHKPRSLFLMNYFGPVTASPVKCKRYNAHDTLCTLMQTCQQNNLAPKKTPNFIALDFVNKGSAMQLVNKLNKQAQKNLLSASQHTE